MKIEELFNILLSDKPSVLLLEYEDSLFSLIPELKSCKDFNQNNEWHVYDVYNHILHVVDNVRCDLVLRLSALFHDVGKPLTYTVDQNGVGHFFGHWEASRRIFDDFSIKYNIDKEISEKVSKMILYHDIRYTKLSDDQKIKFINEFDVNDLSMLYELKKADLLAQNPKYHYLIDDYNHQEKELVMLKR